MVRSVLVVGVAALLFAGAPVAAGQPPAPPAPIIPSPVQPANVGDLKHDATAYYDSGAYLTNLQQAAAPAVAGSTSRRHVSPGPPSSSISTRRRCRTGKSSKPTILVASTTVRATICPTGPAG